jgi:hypothetical protein
MGKDPSPLFEITLVLVRLDHVARFIRRRGSPRVDLSPKNWQANDKHTFQYRPLNQRKCFVISSVPGGIRTHNLLIRSQMLYPVELQTQRNFRF